jgi:hypothetical protein
MPLTTGHELEGAQLEGKWLGEDSGGIMTDSK